MTSLLVHSLSSVCLCNPIDCSTPGSSDNGISQATMLEGVAVPFSRGLPNPGIEPVSLALQADSSLLSHLGSPLLLLLLLLLSRYSRVRLLVTPWTAAHQAPPSMGFSRQESWSGVPLPSPCKPLMGE